MGGTTAIGMRKTCPECGAPRHVTRGGNVIAYCLPCFKAKEAKRRGAVHYRLDREALARNKAKYPRGYPGDWVALSENSELCLWIFSVEDGVYTLRGEASCGCTSRQVSADEFDREWFVVRPNPCHPNGRHIELDDDFAEAVSPERRVWLKLVYGGRHDA